MRFLRIPIVESDARQMPEWIIDGMQEREQERREAPRLELPVPEMPSDEPRPEEAPSTIIVIDL